jgi:chromosome segregation ATPase
MSIIRELLVENYKKVRVVEIRPDGHLVTITGRNGQGKTSVLDAIWFALKGTKALPDKKTSVVRKGSERARVKLGTEEFTITRTMGKDGTAPTLNLEMAKGVKRDKTPQDFLDELFGRLTFDPLEFASMDPADQVEELKKAANVEIDFEALAEANGTDFNERRTINREVAQLEARIASMVVLDGLPKEKLDEAAILTKLEQAGEANKKAQETFQAKQNLGAEASRIGIEKTDNQRFINEQKEKIEELKKKLELAEQALDAAQQLQKEIEKRHKAAERAFHDAPAGEPIDVGALTNELQSAQRTNRAIDTRNEYNTLRTEIDAKKRDAANLTRQMEARDEQKRQALATAKMPVEGLTFDENGVQFKGVPLENMGEGEQLRIAAEIGMAANPKLRVLCIRRGEALDDQGLKMLAELAEQRDFQLWITKVDSSGKVGVVLEDGMVVHHAAE